MSAQKHPAENELVARVLDTAQLYISSSEFSLKLSTTLAKSADGFERMSLQSPYELANRCQQKLCTLSRPAQAADSKV